MYIRAAAAFVTIAASPKAKWRIVTCDLRGAYVHVEKKESTGNRGDINTGNMQRYVCLGVEEMHEGEEMFEIEKPRGYGDGNDIGECGGYEVGGGGEQGRNNSCEEPIWRNRSNRRRYHLIPGAKVVPGFLIASSISRRRPLHFSRSLVAPTFSKASAARKTSGLASPSLPCSYQK